jgi:hypothetical protein
MSDEPPPEFQEKEQYGRGRRELQADDPFWDRAPETVEWRTYRGGSRYDLTRTREEYLEFAWPDGRTEAVGDNPFIIVFTQYDSVTPNGRSQATRDTNFHADDRSVRELYAACATPPRWIGLLRHEYHYEGDDPELDQTFQSYVVVEPPAPRAQPAQTPKTMDRVDGSLEGTGWIKPPPGAVTTEPQEGGGLLGRLRRSWRPDPD